MSAGPGYVYVLRRDDGLYGIGRANSFYNLERRTKVFARYGVPFAVHCLIEADDEIAVERAAHRAFAHCRQGRKELFRLNEREASALLAFKRVDPIEVPVFESALS